jgi:CheY-like chemotaxis protein
MTDRSPFILLVEDDDDERFLAERVLTRAGLSQIRHIPDGLQAKHFLEEIATQPREIVSKPDIVLMDLKLPGMHGQKVLEWMATRSEFGGLLRYVLSSSGNPLDRDAAAKAHVDGYLMKPLTVENVEHLKQAFRARLG